MGSMKGKQAKIDAAFGRLADMIQSGHLLAGTDPVGFLDTVAAELKDLRAECDRIAELKRAIEAMRVAGGSVEFQRAFDMAKALIATPNSAT